MICIINFTNNRIIDHEINQFYHKKKTNNIFKSRQKHNQNGPRKSFRSSPILAFMPANYINQKIKVKCKYLFVFIRKLAPAEITIIHTFDTITHSTIQAAIMAYEDG